MHLPAADRLTAGSACQHAAMVRLADDDLAAGSGVIDTGAGYPAVDTVLPHPFYAPLHWICIVNPGPRTRERLERLLERAHARAARQYGNRRRA